MTLDAGRRAGPRAGGRGGRGPGPGRALGRPPRPPDHGEGLLGDGRAAHHLRRREPARSRPRRERGGRAAAARRRRGALRQDQHAEVDARLADLQRSVRDHPEPLGPGAHLGRLVRWLGRRGLRGLRRPRARLRHRRLDPHPVALLRRLRPQAHLGDRPAARAPPGPAGRPLREGHQRRRPPGPRRRGSRSSASTCWPGRLPDAARAWRLELPPPRHERLADFRVAAWLEEPGFPIDSTEVRERHEAVLDGPAPGGRGRRRPGPAGHRFRPSARGSLPSACWRRSSRTRERGRVPAVVGLSQDGQPDSVAAYSRNIGLRHRDWLFLDDERRAAARPPGRASSATGTCCSAPSCRSRRFPTIWPSPCCCGRSR